MSIISAGTTSTTAFKVTSDTTGSLLLKTGVSGTTAIDIDAAQVVSIGNIAVTGGTINNTIIGGTTAAAGTFTTLTTASTVTLNGGTANGVAYLNGSKNLTTGSALTFDGTNLAVSGDLTVDTSTLKVDSANNFVGIGTTSAVNTSRLNVLRNDGNVQLTLAHSSTKYHSFYVDGNGGLFLQPNGSTALNLDSSGNLGLGVTPSAWDTTVFRTLQLGTGAGSASLSGRSDSANNVALGVNLYYGSGAFRYIATGTATYYNQQNGVHSWLTAASGTAGNTITFTQAMTLDASGNLGLGATSITALGTGYTTQAIQGTNGGGFRLYQSTNERGRVYVASTAMFVDSVTSIPLVFSTDSTERARITAGGDLLVGTTSSSAKFHVKATSAADVLYRLEPYTNSYASKLLISSTSSGDGGIRYGSGGGNLLDIFSYGDMRFFCGTANISGTVGDERARITSAGYLLVGLTSSSTNQFNADKNGDQVLYITNSNSTGAPYGIYIAYPNLSPNNTASYFISCQDSTANRMRVNSNGGIANYQANDINLSDERVKTDIKPVGSYWNKIKAIEIVAFKYKDQTHDDDNVGVIAQQVESVAPEFIETDGWDKDIPEDGVPLKTVYTTDMYHAAIKALQEAMARIEKLESEMSALKGLN